MRLEVTTVDVTLVTATSTDRCTLEEEALVVPGEAQGQSEGFVVASGETASFQVMVAEETLRAGTTARTRPLCRCMVELLRGLVRPFWRTPRAVCWMAHAMCRLMPAHFVRV